MQGLAREQASMAEPLEATQAGLTRRAVAAAAGGGGPAAQLSPVQEGVALGLLLGGEVAAGIEQREGEPVGACRAWLGGSARRRLPRLLAG